MQALTMQIELFSLEKFGDFGKSIESKLKFRLAPAINTKTEADCDVMRYLAGIEDDCIEEGQPEIFDVVMQGLKKSGYPTHLWKRLLLAYRLTQDPKVAPKIAHLPTLDQVAGIIGTKQLDLPPEYLSLECESQAPNKTKSKIDFETIVEGGSINRNVAGQLGEQSVELVLDKLKIAYTAQFTAPFFGWGKKNQSRIDFKVEPCDQAPLDKGFYIEVKWRNRAASVDDNLTALLLNIESWYDLPTLVVYDGSGIANETYNTLEKQMKYKKRKLEGKLLKIMTYSEFSCWAQIVFADQRGAK